MKHILLITSLLFLVSTSAQAYLYDEEGNVIKAEGMQGFYSLEQTEPIAEAFIPGTILEKSVLRRINDFYHVFLIETEDGSVFKLEYIAATGALNKVEIEKLSENPIMPPNMLNEDQAKKIAKDYINDQTSSRLPLKIKKIKLEHKGSTMVYSMTARKGPHTYTLSIDALSRKVTNMEKQ